MESARKLFSILETLCINGEAGVTELSRSLGLGKSSIHRFLSILRDLGYVEKGANNHYFATLKVFEIGALVRGRISLVKFVRPYMEGLGRQIQETINLGLFENGEVVYVDKVESVEALRMDLAIGRRVPAYCTALGKVFLANLSQEELGRYMRKGDFKPFTEKTITSPEKLKENLEEVRREGIAIDDRELDEGIRCIAGPIRDEAGKVIAAISIAGPSMRFTMKKVKSTGETLIKVTADISRKLGYQTLQPHILKERAVGSHG
jgi:DNA-binding IclR family transcriptional regulator